MEFDEQPEEIHHIAMGSEIWQGGDLPSDSGEIVEARRSLRRRGPIELANPEIAPLPPTPITDEARERLQEWGMSDAIDGLRELTSSLRYDLTVEKAERIADRGGYIHRDSEGKETVVLPDLIDHDNHLEGECSELALQLVRMTNETGILNRPETSLQAGISVGLSRTHFTDEASEHRHMWVDIGPEGEDERRKVVADPSFQVIIPAEDSGYTVKTNFRDLETVEWEPNAAIDVGRYTDEGLIEFDGSYSYGILGQSENRRYIYNFGFVRDESSGGEIVPFICTLPASPLEESSSTVVARREDLRAGWSKELTEENMTEMLNVASALSGIELTDDQKEAARLLAEIRTTSVVRPS